MGAYWDGVSRPRHGGDRATPGGPESCGRPGHNTAVRLGADQRPPNRNLPTARLAAAQPAAPIVCVRWGVTERSGNDLSELHAGLALTRTNSFPCLCRETIGGTV